MLVFEPLTLLRPSAAYWVWFSISVGALALSLVLLLSNFPRKRSWKSVHWCLAMAFRRLPITSSWHHKSDRAAILTRIMSALRRGNDFAVGLLLAGASLLRIYPVFITGYLAVRGRWRALIYTIIFGVIGLLVTTSILGVNRTLSFARLYGFLTGPHWLGSRCKRISRRVHLQAVLVGRIDEGWVGTDTENHSCNCRHTPVACYRAHLDGREQRRRQ